MLQVACSPIFGTTHAFVDKMLPRYGVSVSWVSATASVQEYRDALKPTTKVIVYMCDVLPQYRSRVHYTVTVYTCAVLPQYRSSVHYKGDCVDVCCTASVRA